MRYAGLEKNDIVDCDSGICVSLWMQGCPHHCKGCHNSQTWNFNGGEEIDREKLLKIVIDSLTQNGVKRNFSILGGEPLAEQNIADTLFFINKVKEKFSDIKIYLWTGYTIEELKNYFLIIKNRNRFFNIRKILKNIDVLIEGRYKEELRDTTLKLKGSKNQRVLYRKYNYNTKKKYQG